MNTIAERLAWAINRQPREGRRRGLRLFQTRMERLSRERKAAGEAELVGYSLSSIQGYVSDDGPEPSVDFLREAARVLDVRPAWLTYGDGAPTWAEQRAVFESGRAMPTQFERTLRGSIPDWRYLAPSARAEVADAWSALVGDRDPDEVVEDRGQLDIVLGDQVARALGRALGSPLAAVGLDRGVIPPEHDEYVALVCASLRLYARGQVRAATELDDWIEEERTHAKE